MPSSAKSPAAAAVPYYQPFGDECAIFEAAWRNRLPLLIKGPTGCGKTRFIAHMAAQLGLPLHTVACHDDLSAADLVGRHLLQGGATVSVSYTHLDVYKRQEMDLRNQYRKLAAKRRRLNLGLPQRKN